MFKREKTATIDELLKDIESLNGNVDVKTVLERFINNNLMDATGVMIIWTSGKRVDIDGSKFSEVEAYWALGKAQHELLNKGISFQ